MDELQFVIEGDTLFLIKPAYYAGKDMYEKHPIITKDVFKELYKKWILGEEKDA